MDVFFVYIDWTTEQIPRPFYIGKGKFERIQIVERNEHWKHVADKHGWRREVVLATKDEAYAFLQEILGILEHGTFCGSNQYRWGTNKTAGGEGSTGHHHVWSEVQREKKRGLNNASTRPEVREQIRQTLLVKKPLVGISKTISTLEKKSKITRQQAEDIRTKWLVGGISQRQLAIEYGLAKCSICNIIAGRKWKQDAP